MEARVRGHPRAGPLLRVDVPPPVHRQDQPPQDAGQAALRDGG